MRDKHQYTKLLDKFKKLEKEKLLLEDRLQKFNELDFSGIERKILRKADVGYWYAIDGSIHHYNSPELLHFMGVLPDTDAHKDPDIIDQYIFSNEAKKISEMRKEAIAEKKDRVLTYRMKGDDGEIANVIERIGCYVTDEHEYVYGYIQDISKWKESENRLTQALIKNRALVEALPDMIFVIDKNGIFKDYYTDDETKLYVSPERVLGSSINELMPKEVADLTLLKVSEVIRTKDKRHYKYDLQFKDHTQYYESQMVPYYKDQVIAVVRNITARVEAERQIVEAEKHTRQLLDVSPVGIFYMETDGRIIYINSAAQDIFGIGNISLPWYSEPFLRQLFKSFTDIEGLLKKLEDSEENNLHFETGFTRKDGKELELNVRMIQQLDNITNKPVLFGYVEDITELVRVNRRFKENEERLKEVQSISKIGYWEFDNQTFEFHGYQDFLKYYSASGVKARMKVEEFIELVHPDDRQRLIDIYDGDIARKSFIVEQFRIIIDNKEIWVEVRSKFKIIDKKKNITQVYGSIQDIGDIKEKEELIKQNENFLQILIEKIPVSVFAKDPKTGKYTIWNKASVHLYGIQREKVLGKTDYDVFPEKMAKLFVERDDEVLKRDVAVEFLEEEIETPGNIGKRIVNSTAVPIKHNGKVRSILGISIDVTEKINVERELMAAKNRAEKSDKQKSRYLANMSHEIRNPMNAILGFSKILAEDERISDEEKHEFISLINTNAKQLLTLISDIIDIAKIENGKLKIFRKSFNLNATLNGLQNIYQKETEDHPDIEIKLEKDLPDKEAYFYTDESRFMQIFNNLISNAIKFTPTGFVRFGYVKEKPDMLSFFVEDIGSGIDAADKEDIFEEFKQLENSDQSNKGKGLGLSISKQLVQYLGGEIWLDTDYDKGARFCFTLPHDENAAKKSGEKLEGDEKPAQKRTYDWSSHKLMIVDDAPDIISFISILLKRTKITTYTATNGKEALQEIEENPDIELILMDIQMPEMNGIEAMKHIKKSNPDIFVIAQTAFAMEGDRERFFEDGFDDYVPKPINKKKLFNKIDYFLKKGNS